MLLDLSSVLVASGKTLDFKDSLTVDEIETFLGNAKVVDKKINIMGKAINSASVVTIEYTVSFDYLYPCDRCLEETIFAYSKDFCHTVIKLDKDDTVEDNNDDSIFIKGYNLLLDDIVLGDISLNMPSKYLCSDDCKGICPKCYKNLNDGKCDCEKDIDPRLEKLKEFFN